ncbi:MAG: ATP-binding protein [Chitinivibrionales bacterium]|nr:ATP-binding protein [Chitinivibrionales bacterium]
MVLTHILCVGITSQVLERTCAAHGYVLVHAPSIEACAQVDQVCGLMLLHQDVLSDLSVASMEQLYFLNNTIPVIILIADYARLPVSLGSKLREGTLEYVYEHEIESGLIAGRIDRLYLYAQLNQSILAMQHNLGDQQTLRQELKLRETMLDHERRLNADLIASLTIGLIILDTDGQIILLNDHARLLLAIAANDLFGVSYFSIFPAEIRADVADMISSVQADSTQDRIKKVRFNHHVLEISCHRMIDYQRRSSGILLLMQDISEQEAMSAQLYQAEKLATMGTMLSGIAHELRNPLSIISARLLRLRMQPLSDHVQTDKNLQSIETQVQRCAAIIDNLLNFARNRVARTGYHGINEICEEAIAYAAYQANFSALKVCRKFGEELFVYGDRSRFVQVVLNIINNAVDAMNDAGTLTIKTGAGDGGSVLVDINDTGPGIDKAIRKKIFDPFFTTREPGHGTGLGLTIAYKIVTESKGEIRVASEPGNTTFTIKLPSSKEKNNG